MPPYCPISSTVPHTSTPPTCLTPSHTPIAANTFFSGMHILCLKALAHNFLYPPTTLLQPSHTPPPLPHSSAPPTTHFQPYHTRPPLPPYTSTSSEWCMRTHYICHPTALFTALSHIPSPLLHTSPSHHTSHTHPHLPHSSPLPIHLPQTSTPPTHLHSFPHTNCNKYLLLQNALLVFRSLRTFDEHNSSD